MASLELPSEIPMQQLNTKLIEDEYGYVDTNEHCRKISRDLMMQLPSRNLDNLTQCGEASSVRDRGKDSSLNRKDSHYQTLKLNRITIKSGNIEDDADKVYELLISDPNIEKDEIKHNLRDLHQSLTLRRMVKARLESDQERNKQHTQLGCCTRFRYRVAMSWHKFKYDLQGLSYSLELWHQQIKKIQGHFGSCVASYFIFLRWLLYLNIFNLILSFGFIFVPQLIYLTSDKVIPPVNASSEAFSGYDLITGSGWIGDSSFYYGHYTNTTIQVAYGCKYNMPLAYLFTVGIAAIVNLVVVAWSVTKSYQRCYVDTSDELKNIFCNKIFCAWDYTIETLNAADLRKRCIYNELKELVFYKLKAQRIETFCSKVMKCVVGAAVNIFLACVSIAIGYLVYFILDRRAVEVNMRVVGKMTLALTVTAISIFFHYLISYATKLEYFFSKQIRLYLTMGRVVALRIIVLSVLVYFWMVIYIPKPGDTSCYESLLGEEIYRLIFVNFFMNLIICTLGGEYLRTLFSKFLCKDNRCLEPAEFDVAYNTNDLIYYQTLAWVGAFYSPLLPSLLIVILILLFYLKLNSVSINCKPSQKSWSAAQTQTVFLILTFLNFILSAISNGYTIFSVKPSSTCGPFQTKNNTYNVVTDLLELPEKQGAFIRNVFMYGSSPGVMFSAFLAICVAVYFARAYAQVHGEIVNLIREQLIMESKDKVFLLRLFESAYQQKMRSRAGNSSDRLDHLGGDSTESDHSERSHNNNNRYEVMNQIYKDYYQGLSGATASTSSPVAFQGKYDPGYLLADVPANNLSPDRFRNGSENVSTKDHVHFFPSSNYEDEREHYPNSEHGDFSPAGRSGSPFRSDLPSTSYQAKKRQGNKVFPDHFDNGSRDVSPKDHRHFFPSSNSDDGREYYPNSERGDFSPASPAESPHRGNLPSPSYQAKKRQGDRFPKPVHQQGFQYLVRGETPPRTSNRSLPKSPTTKRVK